MAEAQTGLFTKPVEECKVKQKVTVFWKSMLARIETWTLCPDDIKTEISRTIQAYNIEVTWKERGLGRGWGDILIEYGPTGQIVYLKDAQIEEVEEDGTSSGCKAG